MAKLQIPVTSDDHIQGEAEAPITLVEYADYECPHCRTADGVVKRLQQRYGVRLRFVFRNFPLPEMHPHAEAAAEAAEAAAEQGKFWEMHDAIFDHQEDLDPSMLGELAAAEGLDVTKIENAIEDQDYTERIEADVAGGMRSGVHGTPTFFINGKRHDGVFDYDDMVEAIDAG